MPRVILTGLPEVDRALKKLGVTVGNKVVKKAMRTGLKEITKPAVVRETPVDTGYMRTTIKIKTGKRSRKRNTFSMFVDYDSKKSRADTGKYYVPFVEFGAKNRGRKPQHNMKRAFEATRDALRDRVQTLLREGVELAARVI